MTLGERLQNLRKENMLSQEKLAGIFRISIDEFTGRAFVENEVTDEMSEKINKENLKKHLYILGAIIGFLAFAVSMTLVESNSLFVIVGMAGMVGMGYCISNIMKLH